MSKNIVILGAGFGGIKAAKTLARALKDRKEEWKIILIDRSPVHIYYPKLFEEVVPCSRSTYHVARNTKGTNAKCTLPIQEILKGTGVEFVQGAVEGIGWKEKKVVIAASPTAPRNDIEYDYLILALGADADYFGIPGLKEYATVLRSVEDAEMIKSKVEGFLKIHNSPQPSLNFPPTADPPWAEREGEKSFSVVIGGAGATGVELAAALAYQFRSTTKATWSVTLIEALPRVLSMFPNALSQYAHRRLEQLGVKLQLDTCIKEVKVLDSVRHGGLRSNSKNFEVVLAPRPLKPGEAESDLMCDFLPEHEKRIQPDLLIWTGGVRATGLLASCNILTDKKGRVEVDEHMVVKGIENVFAIGDNALLIDPASKQPVAGTAQAALREAEIAAGNIVAAIRTTTPVLYPFPKFSAIIPLAGRDAVALLGTRVIKGFAAWLLRQAADCRYFASIIGWWKAVKKCIL